MALLWAGSWAVGSTGLLLSYSGGPLSRMTVNSVLPVCVSLVQFWEAGLPPPASCFYGGRPPPQPCLSHILSLLNGVTKDAHMASWPIEGAGSAGWGEPQSHPFLGKRRTKAL